MPKREDVYDVGVRVQSLAHADIERELDRPTPVRSWQRDHTTQMGELTGVVPSYRFVGDALYVSHDCRTRRVSALVNTHDFYGWVILRRPQDTHLRTVLLNRPVSCSGCHNLYTALFVPEDFQLQKGRLFVPEDTQ